MILWTGTELASKESNPAKVEDERQKDDVNYGWSTAYSIDTLTRRIILR